MADGAITTRCGAKTAPCVRISARSRRGSPIPRRSAWRRSAARPTCSSTASASPSPSTATKQGTERLIPFDTIPRIIPQAEWSELERGLRAARHRAQPLPARHLPRPGDPQGRRDPGRAGAHATTRTRWRWWASTLPNHVYSHIAGIDIVRHDDGKYYVLEDNLRMPSGVSYMLENRKMMMRLFPELFGRQNGRAGRALSRPAARDAARGRAAARCATRRWCVLTPGHVQQRLLRARLPRAADGRRAGRGQRPVRQGRLRLHAHHARPAARRRDLPPHRRRLPRPARVPRRLGARRARACSRPTARATWRSPTRSAPAWPTTSRSIRTCRR